MSLMESVKKMFEGEKEEVKAVLDNDSLKVFVEVLGDVEVDFTEKIGAEKDRVRKERSLEREDLERKHDFRINELEEQKQKIDKQIINISDQRNMELRSFDSETSKIISIVEDKYSKKLKTIEELKKQLDNGAKKDGSDKS